MDEKHRIEAVYEARKRQKPRGYYSLFQPGNLYMVQQKEWAFAKIMESYRLPLNECEILDIGCGSGLELRSFLKFGASVERLHGIDLISERVETAKSLSPNLDIREGDATSLPFPDESFDIVMQSTVFSSIVEPKIQEKVAREMLRVLRPGGAILWYDMRITDPRNSNLVPLTRKRVRELFPSCGIQLEAHTLNPLLARAIAPHSRWMCLFLEAFPFLRSHLYGWITK